MVILMGGRYSQGYQLFMNLTVKAFLAIRPFTDQIVDTVQLMLDTGLPSFKGESTIRRLRDRFALHLNERQAAEFMVGIIRNAHENVRSTAYDEFQRVSMTSIALPQTAHAILRQLQNGTLHKYGDGRCFLNQPQVFRTSPLYFIYTLSTMVGLNYLINI